MPEEITTLRFGGQMVGFKKSDRLVGLKFSPSPVGTIERTLAAVAPTATAGEKLGGFKMLNVPGGSAQSNGALDLLRSEPAVSVGTHVFHTSDDEVPFVPTGDIYIVFRADVDSSTRAEILANQGLALREARGTDAIIAAVTAVSPNPVKVAAALQDLREIEISEPEFATPAAVQAFELPSGQRLSDQWHLRNTGFHRGTSTGFVAGADARVIDAWTLAEGLGSTQVIVAVIDDGFDLGHPDLSMPGKVVGPWDFTRSSNDPTPDPDEQDWHGTPCAGVALAQSANAGVYGAAPGATLMPVRWGPDLSDSQIEQWFGYVTSKGAWVVNCSWSARARNYPLSSRSVQAISQCASSGRDGTGCVIVFAAGNANHNVNDPAAGTVNGFAIHPDVIAVAASTSQDLKSDYSNYGAEISVCSPSSGAGGWGILTTDVTGARTIGGATQRLGYAVGDYTSDFGGTSSAAPLVAGICALVLSIAPDLKASDVKKLIEATARKIGGLGPGETRSDVFGHGCVDGMAAVRAAQQAVSTLSAQDLPVA